MNYTVIQKALSRKDIALVVAFVLFLSTFFTYKAFASPGHDGGHSSIEGGSSQFPVVTVAKAESAEDRQENVVVSGVVLSKKQSVIHPSQDGVLDALFVDIGDRVVKGQVLGYLKPSVGQLQLQAQGIKEQAQLDAIDNKIALSVDGSVISDGTKQSSYIQELEQLNTDIAITNKELNLAKESFIVTNEARDKKMQTLLEKEVVLQTNLKNAAVDVIDDIGKILYDTTNISVAVTRNLTRDYRFALYTLGRGSFMEVANDFRGVFARVNGADQVNLELAANVGAVGQNVRRLITGYGSNNPLLGSVADLQHELDESLDHLYNIQASLTNIDAEIEELRAAQLVAKAKHQQEVARIKGDVSKFEADKKSAEVTFVNNIEALRQERKIQSQNISALYTSASAGNVIRAPFSGVITKRMVSAGESVSFEKGLLEIIDDDELFVRFTVSEEDLPFVQPNTLVKISPTSLPSSITEAPIARQSSVINPQTGGLIVEATLPKDRKLLLANMSVTIEVPVSADESALAVPRNAVELGGGNKVWIVNQSVEAEQRNVEVLFVKNETAFVSGDIDTKTWVITSSPEPLKEGLEIDTELE